LKIAAARCYTDMNVCTYAVFIITIFDDRKGAIMKAKVNDFNIFE
jgi:hypothetical protein